MFWNKLPTKAGKANHCRILKDYMRDYAKIEVILRFSLADLTVDYGTDHDAPMAARALKTFCAGE